MIDDYRISWTGSWGVTTPGEAGRPVTPETRFQAASVAKAVTALAVLQQGSESGWSLDADINTVLKRWQLPHGEAQSDGPVALRQLLSHTGGITPGGFPGYPRGETLPGLVQILEGQAPANNPAARVLSSPGGEVAYSGLGYTALQLALEDRLGRDFNELMRKTVLGPLGMSRSGFHADLPETLAAEVARGHASAHAVPVTGGWRSHPELAAAGCGARPPTSLSSPSTLPKPTGARPVACSRRRRPARCSRRRLKAWAWASSCAAKAPMAISPIPAATWAISPTWKC